MHLDILNTSDSLPPIFNTKFSAEQLEKLSQVSSNAHYSNRIGSMGPGQAEMFHQDHKGHFPDKSKLVQIKPEEYQKLWDKVKHSFYYNIYYLSLFAEGKFDEANAYENSSRFDDNAPTPEIIARVNELISKKDPLVEEYRMLITVVNNVLDSEQGKALLKDYRAEFRKGHKGQGIWNDQGENKDHWYRVEFAQMVQQECARQGIETRLTKEKLDYLLYIANVVWR